MPPGTEPQKISSDQGWHHLTRAFSRTMPAKLHASGKARQGLMALTRARGHR